MPTYQPGAAWTGNRKGRPKKGQALADHLRAALARPYRPGQTHGQRVAEVVVELAMAGNLEAARWLADRTDGPLPRPAPAPGAYPERVEVALDVEHRHTLEVDDERVAAVLAYVAAQRGLLPGGG